MATYTDLYALENDASMRNKVRVAITIAADKVTQGNDDGAPFDQAAGAHDNRKVWVVDSGAFNPSPDLIQKYWNAMLANNNAASTGTITGAADSLIQTNVETFIDIFAGN